MVNSSPDERREVWSRYWATGMPHSCGGSYDSTYGGNLGAFWRETFVALTPGERVLDIATGSGALPRLLLAVQRETSIECDAVDLAQIAPAWLHDAEPAQRQRVHLHGGVVAEDLPFAGGTFSLVMSQYGIEYADLSRAIPEALRVLSPSGRVRIVAHHAASQPVRLAGDEINHIDWLLERDGLLDLAAAMIRPMARSTTPAGRAALAGDSQANQVRARFNGMQDVVSARIAGSVCPDVLHEVREQIGQVFQIALTHGLDKATHALRDVRDRLADSRLRLDELRRHALDEEAAQALCAQLARDGARVTRRPLSDAGHLLGWAICGDPNRENYRSHS